MQVRNFMTTNLVVIDKDKDIGEAKQLLDAHNFRHLPVMDDGKIVGVMSDRDINRSVAISRTVKAICGVETGKELKIGEIMTNHLMSVGPDEHIRSAAKAMAEKKIGCLPVLEDGNLVGIITETDLLKVFMEMVDYIGK